MKKKRGSDRIESKFKGFFDEFNFILILIFAIFGAVLASVFVHEFVHYLDVKSSGGTNIDMCVYYFSFSKKVTLDSPIGYIHHAGKEIKSTEFRALFYQIISIIIFLFFILRLIKIHFERC